MKKAKIVDNGLDINWDNASANYAKYRNGPPSSFYRLIEHFGIGLPGQKILDEGTGTGVLARQFARQGCEVTGTDPSAGQIEMAMQLAQQEELSVDFRVAPAEDQPFADQSFDIITASQCESYFDKKRWIPETRRLLRADGKIVIVFFSYLPLVDPVSKMSEALLRKHNPDWSGHSWSGEMTQNQSWAKEDFHQRAFIIYDEPIRFTREFWRGRWRARRGTGASLSPERIQAFDQEHDQLLKENFGDEFEVLHRVATRILQFKSAT